MVASVLLARGASPLQRCAFLAALVVVFIGLVHYLDVIPGSNVLTTSRTHAINRLVVGSEAGRQYHMEPLCAPGAFEHLKKLGLSPEIKYSRRCIRPVSPEGVLDRDAVTNITSPLLTNGTTINLNHPDGCSTEVDSLPCDPIELPVPRPEVKNHGQYSHLIFGVATTYERLGESLPQFAHWLADSGAPLVGLIVDDPAALPDSAFSALESEYAAHGMELKLVPKHDPAHTTEQSHMMVIEDMLAHADSSSEAGQSPDSPQWLGVLDDDTFFPSLPALASVLAAHDHTRHQYLGQLTENAALLTAERVLGGFGGAGIFLSAVLARDLRPHLDACRSDIGGDMQIMDCVHRHSAARLTRVPGLWQCDFVGDSAGFYESGRRVLSMHHWKSWNQLPAREMAAVTRVCGACFLQRFVFGGLAAAAGADAGGRDEVRSGKGEEETVVLNNGYSINVYAAGVALPDLSRTEQTWDDWDRDPWKDYQWSLGPLRERIGKDEKKTYSLVTVVSGEEDGELTQVYLRRGEGEGENDEVIELVWQPS